MGEAKQRKEDDPLYGRYPKKGKGIIISNPIQSMGNRGLNVSSELDPFELRHAVLFYDEIVWPKNRKIYISGSVPEVEYLEGAGIMRRPIIEDAGGEASEIFPRVQRRCFESLTAQEPGKWVVSNALDSTLLEGEGFSEGRGIYARLVNGIPTPDADVPLEDLLEFKHQRRDEFRRLSMELDRLYERVIQSSDLGFSTDSAFRELQVSCSDAIKASKSSKISIRQSGIKIGFSANLGSIDAVLVGAARGGALFSTVGMAEIGAALGGAASFLTLERGVGRRSERENGNPYSVVADIHREYINRS